MQFYIRQLNNQRLSAWKKEHDDWYDKHPIDWFDEHSEEDQKLENISNDLDNNLSGCYMNGISEYVRTLCDNGYEVKELPQEILYIYAINYLISEVDNGGFWQFICNLQGLGFDILYDIHHGLVAINELEVDRIMNDVFAAMDSAEEETVMKYLRGDFRDEFDSPIESEWMKLSKIHDELNGEFYSHTEVLTEKLDNYFESLKDVTVLSDEEYEKAMTNLVMSLEDREERLKARQEQDELYYQQILDVCLPICKKFNLNLELADIGQATNESVDYQVMSGDDDYTIRVFLNEDKIEVFNFESNQVIGSCKRSEVLKD